MWPTLVVAAGSAVAYLALAPRVVNGDGLGYLKAALAGTIYPGHVAYVPLLGALAKVTGATRPIELLWPARVVSALAAATAIALAGSLARRRWQTREAGWAAALGLAVSWGALSAGSDVESYAPALAALVAALWLASSGRPVAAGLACAAATLFHVENVLLVPVAALLVERRPRPETREARGRGSVEPWRDRPRPETREARGRGSVEPWRDRARLVVAAALPLAVVYGALLPAHGVAWLAGASHGLHYPLRWTTPFVAIYGACKALVYSPYLYEASVARVVGCFVVGAAAAAALATCARRPFSRAATLAWIAPYALVGVAFWASDAERWTFLLPLVWIAAAARPRRAAAVAVLMCAANLVVWLPSVRDDRVRTRALAAAAHLADGDLIIGPGHGWDEYIPFYSDKRLATFPLVFHAGALGRNALPAALAHTINDARAHQIWLARFAEDADPMGWKELRLFAIDRAVARSLLPPGHAIPVADGLERYVVK